MKGITRIVCAAVLVFLAGCGADWFPEYKQAATDPNSFTIPNKTGVPLGSTVVSDAVTLSGITADSSPISVSDSSSSNSMYAINGGTPVATAGTVKNGDRVTVQHTASSVTNGIVVTTLTIGNFITRFTSIAASSIDHFDVTNSSTSGSLFFTQRLDLPTAEYTITISSNGKYSFNQNGPFIQTTSTQTIFTGATNIYLINLTPGKTTITFNNIPSTYTTTLP